MFLGCSNKHSADEERSYPSWNMISLWFFNKAKKRWVVSSRGSAGNSKLLTCKARIYNCRIWTKWYYSKCSGGPSSWGSWESLRKLPCPPTVCKSASHKVPYHKPTWGESACSLYRAYLMCCTSQGNPNPKHQFDEYLFIKMQINSTCSFTNIVA